VAVPLVPAYVTVRLIMEVPFESPLQQTTKEVGCVLTVLADSGVENIVYAAPITSLSNAETLGVQ